MKNKSVRDNGERYPTPVAAFDVWFKARCHEAATAKSRYDLDVTVDMVRAYADAEWCMPTRLGDIRRIAQKRSTELARSTDHKMAAAGDV
jgi:hypothetical protein